MREHKQREHESPRCSGDQSDDVAQLMGDVDDNSLKEELETCKHLLVDIEIENGRQRVYNFAMVTLDLKYLLKMLDVVFGSLKCAAKPNVAFGFVLKNVRDGNFKYSYAHENNTLLERSKLVVTTEDLTKIRNLLRQIDVIELCTRERANTIWKIDKLTNATTFAA